MVLIKLKSLYNVAMDTMKKYYLSSRFEHYKGLLLIGASLHRIKYAKTTISLIDMIIYCIL